MRAAFSLSVRMRSDVVGNAPYSFFPGSFERHGGGGLQEEPLAQPGGSDRPSADPEPLRSHVRVLRSDLWVRVRQDAAFCFLIFL